MSSFYPETLFKIVLLEPEIPNNTGNIGRTCVGTWSQLHLVGPLGFSIDDKSVKRAGLDYWQNLDLIYHKDCHTWQQTLSANDRVHIIETGSTKTIYEIDYQPGDHLVFGRETSGVPKQILEKFKDHVYSIPFPGQIRSFNLSNCVAMVMGEALRQRAINQDLRPSRPRA